MLKRFDLANVVLKGVSQAISVRQNRCTRIKHKNSPCTACHANCAADAISVGGPGSSVRINHEKCTGCGICVTVCPTHAITLRNNGYNEFIDKCTRLILPDGTLNITCAERPLGASKVGATFQCIGVINAIDILLLYLRGASKINILHGNCHECDCKNGAKVIEAECRKLLTLAPIFEDLNDLSIDFQDDYIIIEFPLQKPIVRAPVEEKPNPVVDRRGLFSFFKNNAKETAIKSVTMVMTDKPEERTIISFEKFMPTRRKMFLDIIMQLGNLTASEVGTGALFNNINITPSCVFCGMCARFCPTGALETNEEKSYIKFNPSKCISCMLCKPACFHGYLDYKPELALKDFFSDLTLIEKELPEEA